MNLQNIKNIYLTMKSIGDQETIQFLDVIVSYCKYIGYDKDKTLMMLALIRNFLPEPGQKFTDCDKEDEVDNKYTKKIIDSFDILQKRNDGC